MAKVFAGLAKFGMRAVLLLSVLNAAYAESERCVPAPDGSWHCGKDVTEADAAPLPERQTRSLPPVMLIDPARFGEGDLETDAVAEEVRVTAAPIPTEAKVVNAKTASPAATQIPATAQALAAITKPAAANQPHTTAIAEADLASNGKYSVQLALASTPRGFDALLARLGSAARNSQRRQLANGSWVLLIGSFTSIAQARNAVPSSVPGAFARDISTLNFK